MNEKLTYGWLMKVLKMAVFSFQNRLPLDIRIKLEHGKYFRQRFSMFSMVANWKAAVSSCRDNVS